MKRVLKKSTAFLLALLMIVSATVLTTGAQGPVNGFGQENGNWYYYKNSQIDTSRNDVIQGTVNGQDGWWYVVGGQVQLNYTGVANYANDYGWWYIKNGKVDFSCNSVEQNNYGWWYVTGGKVDFSYTGVANYANANGWWYIKNGKVDFSKTGVEQNNYGWWRVVGGKVDFSCNSVEQNDYGWWYLLGGQVQFGYTGVANYANAYGWWYIKDGKVDFSKTGVEQNNYGWWRVVNGKVDFSCNSVEQNDYGWWYVVGGQVQFGYAGVANYANAYGWWYINGGKVDFSFTGLSSNNYGSWYCVNGKVDFTSKVYDVNQLSQKQQNMLAVMDSVAGTTSASWYDVDAVVSAFYALFLDYYYIFGIDWTEIVCVSEALLKECASAMFPDYNGDLSSLISYLNNDVRSDWFVYDNGNFYICIAASRGAVRVSIRSWVEHADGTCTVEIQFMYAGGPNRPEDQITSIYKYELVKNKYTESMADPTFIYTIASMECTYYDGGNFL